MTQVREMQLERFVQRQFICRQFDEMRARPVRGRAAGLNSFEGLLPAPRGVWALTM